MPEVRFGRGPAVIVLWNPDHAVRSRCMHKALVHDMHAVRKWLCSKQ